MSEQIIIEIPEVRPDIYKFIEKLVWSVNKSFGRCYRNIMHAMKLLMVVMIVN